MMRRLARLTVFCTVWMFIGVAVAQAATVQHSPVLGRKGLYGQYGRGWGAHRPVHIANGGDPSGDVTRVHWYSWGRSAAHGHGSGYQFKPGGGYYAKLVRVQFRATRLGHCTTHGPLAYRRLYFRAQVKPGSTHYTKWQLWAGLPSICSRST